MRFFAIYGLLVGTVTTCVAVLFALVIDTEPDLNGRPDTPVPTAWPSGVPTNIPTGLPSDFPSGFPTDFPSGFPTELPSDFPTGFPTDFPSGFPTELPSGFPSDWLTTVPTYPTDYPTGLPTDFSAFPTTAPSVRADSAADEWTPSADHSDESPEAP